VRTAAISESIKADLEAWKAIAPNNHDEWIFPNENGNKPLAQPERTSHRYDASRY
jgi:hypothetical protein